MAQQIVDSKVGELGLGNDEAGSSAEDKQPSVPVKKTPLRDLRSENNIVLQKGSCNPLVLKEAVITESAKVSGLKRPSPEAQMNTYQQSANSNGANGHLVYVRRKSEAETGRVGNNEVIAHNAQSPPASQPGRQEHQVQTKSLVNEVARQCLSANAPMPTSTMSIPSVKPTVPLAYGTSDTKAAFEEDKTQTVPTSTSIPVNPSIPLTFGSSDTKEAVEEHQTQAVRSPISLSAEASVNKQNWEERYIHLQMYLKKIDQSSLEDHLQALRSLSAAELSRHAVELEKRAIQLSLEQGKELQRVKALNVLGKPLRTPNGPALQQTQQN